MPHYRLIDSATSPYVRRLRLYLAQTPYAFERLALVKETDPRKA